MSECIGRDGRYLVSSRKLHYVTRAGRPVKMLRKAYSRKKFLYLKPRSAEKQPAQRVH